MEESDLIQLAEDLHSVISERTCDIIRKYPPAIDTSSGKKRPHMPDFTDLELEIIKLSNSGFSPMAEAEIERRKESKRENDFDGYPKIHRVK